MPYIKKSMKDEIESQGFSDLCDYLNTVPIDLRKGFVAYIVMYLGKCCFPYSYFGLSTGADAVRSALTELVKELEEYEAKKKEENGGV